MPVPLGGKAMSQVETERLDRALREAQADLVGAASVAEAGKDGGVNTRTPQADLLRFTGNRLVAIEAADGGSSLTTRERIGRQMLKPKKNNNYWNHPAASAQEVRIAEEKRNRELYGDALEDVEFLRRCGWAINLLPSGRVQFGSQILTLDELREKAERERRLRQPAPAPIGATRVQA
jgi:hypothetical protein